MTQEIRNDVLSASGKIGSGDQIVITAGTVDDWSLFVFADHFERPVERANSESDNSMIGVRVDTQELPGRQGWRVIGDVYHRVGGAGHGVLTTPVKSISYLVVRRKLP